MSAEKSRMKRLRLLQQDNDPNHTSDFTMTLTVPELNIENLWIDLNRAVHARRPKNLTDLEKFCSNNG